MRTTDPEVTRRLGTLIAVSPSRADVIERLDQAIAIAKMGGIETRTLEAVLGYGVMGRLTPGTVAALNAVGIDTRPWADLVAEAGGLQAITDAARDLGLGCSLLEDA